MSNKDKNNNSSVELCEDITKNLVKKILEEDENTYPGNSNNNEFNIEYEKYDGYEDDDEYFEETNKIKNFPKNATKKNKVSSSTEKHRKNIEKYSDDFFSDDFDDYDDDKPISFMARVIATSVIVVLTISTALLALNLKSTKNQLKSAKVEIQELTDTKEATEQKLVEESLRNEISALKIENETLKSQITPTQDIEEDDNESSNNSDASEYIVKEGDIVWNISKELYGNGAYYQEILDANGLTENSVLSPGQKLIIPKIN